MASTNPQYATEQYLFNTNMDAANKHKVEDFKVGEHVYVWMGTFAGTTTGIVEEAEPGATSVKVRFEDDSLPPSLQGHHLIAPRDLMHEGEFRDK